jgi:hypothetical protein
MSHTVRFRAALALPLLLATAAAGRAVPTGMPDPFPAAIVDVVVEDVTDAPAGLAAMDHLVTVERVLRGSVPGTSLIVRMPVSPLQPVLRAGERALVALTPAHDGSFRLLHVLRETRIDPVSPAQARAPDVAARAALGDGSFAPLAGEAPETGGSAAESIVTGLFEGNGFVSTLAALNLEGIGGSLTVALKDAEGEAVGGPAVLTFGPRILRLQPLSRMFPEVVSHRGPFTLQLLSNGILFSASAILLDVESRDEIFIPATPLAAGGPAAAGEMFFPRVVRGPNPFDTVLTSRLVAFNPASEGRLLTLELWERGQDNTSPRTAYRYVEPGRSLRVDDVLSDLFGLDEGIGALRITWSGPAGLAPRIVSLLLSGSADGQGKRFGALVDAATAAGAIRDRGAVLGAGQTATSRASFGLVNLASAAGTTLRLTLRDTEGHALAVTRIGLKPRQQLERNVAGLFPGIAGGEDWNIETEVLSGGPVLPYLARLEAGGDISYSPGQVR